MATPGAPAGRRIRSCWEFTALCSGYNDAREPCDSSADDLRDAKGQNEEDGQELGKTTVCQTGW